MHSFVFTHRHAAIRLALGLQAALLSISLAAIPAMAEGGATAHEHQAQATPVSQSGTSWQEALVGQTKVEEAIEGRAGRSEQVELQHHRLMDRMQNQMQQDAAAQQTSGGYNNMSMMHQYMGQDGSSFLLASDFSVEPVAGTGGRCPAGVPVKQYDVSMIAVEITLNQWLDFYPGYMYVLTESIDKVRAEEKRNAEARESDEHEWDPGAVSNGLQGDAIQPLVASVASPAPSGSR